MSRTFPLLKFYDAKLAENEVNKVENRQPVINRFHIVSIKMSQRQCLPIEEDEEEVDSDQDFDMNNDSAAKYIQKVRFERNRIPQIVTVHPMVMHEEMLEEKPVQSDEKLDHDPVKPSKEWQQIQCEKFEEMHQRINELRENPKFQDKFTPPEVEIDVEYCRVNEPKLSTVISLHQGYIETVIEELLTHFDKNLEDLNAQTIEQISWIPKWFYALFACLHLPLDPDIVSNLRVTAKNCHRVINFLKSQSDDAKEECQPYNLIIGIVRLNFKQFDL